MRDRSRRSHCRLSPDRRGPQRREPAVSRRHNVRTSPALLGSPDNPRIVRVFSQPTEIVPSGVVLILSNKDRPGIVGYLGTLMGQAKVNIASMSLSRDIAGGHALTVLNLDSVPPPEVLDEIQ